MNLRATTDRADLLSHFLQMKNADGSPVHPMEVFGEAMNVVMAGADTTVSLLYRSKSSHSLNTYDRLFQSVQ